MLLGKLQLLCIVSCIHGWLELQFIQWCFTIKRSWAPGLDTNEDEDEKFTVTRLRNVLDSLGNFTVLCIQVAQPCLTSLSFTPASDFLAINHSDKALFQHFDHKLWTHGRHDKISCLLLSSPCLLISKCSTLGLSCSQGACQPCSPTAN